MKENQIATYCLLGLILGVLVGAFLYDPDWSSAQGLEKHASSSLLYLARFFGLSIFLAALKVLIVPLIASTVFVAVARIGSAHLGRLTTATLLYYASTMLIAVVIGLVLVTAIEPGRGVVGVDATSISVPDAAHKGMLGIVENLTSLLLPENILHSMAAGQTLSVICFFIFFGIACSMLGEQTEGLVRIGEQLSVVFLRMVRIVLHLAPLGVFCLIVDTVAQMGLGFFGKTLGAYVLCVTLGLCVHAFVVLPLFYRIFCGSGLFTFLKTVRAALLMAFGTASSSATLPVSLRLADAAGVRSRISGVVLPLGSTINMDGTALYEAVAVVFLAQLSGIDLGMAQLLVIAFTATLAAVGAAGIPSAGLVTLFVVVDAVNASLSAVDASALGISVASVGILLGVDRILDMMRTTVNVWGDLVGAAVIDARLE